MEHFICCDQSSTKKVTCDKFRQLMTILFSTTALTITTFALSKNHPNQRYFNVGPNLTKIVTGINFRTTNYFNQSINEIINWLLWEELLKLETMMDQKIGSRELLQKAPVVITKYGDFWFYILWQLLLQISQLIYSKTETFIIRRDEYSKWNNCITKYGRYFHTGRLLYILHNGVFQYF